MQRYFASLKNHLVVLEKDDLFHLTTVMRAKEGDLIEVVIYNKLYLAKIINLKEHGIQIIKELEIKGELETKLTLIFTPLKRQNTELVIQKATELGVSEIILVETERTIPRFKKEDLKHKLNRYQKIIKEASEQAKRLTTPKITFINNLEKVNYAIFDLKIIANENIYGPTNTFNDVLSQIKTKSSIALLIGPEGGFTNQEIEVANSLGFISVSLGSRLYRAETAALFALSVIVNKLEYK